MKSEVYGLSAFDRSNSIAVERPASVSSVSSESDHEQEELKNDETMTIASLVAKLGTEFDPVEI